MPVVQEMLFKIISYLFSSGGNLVEWSETFLHNVGRGHNKKNVYEFILNLDQWFRRGAF